MTSSGPEPMRRPERRGRGRPDNNDGAAGRSEKKAPGEEIIIQTIAKFSPFMRTFFVVTFIHQWDLGELDN
ncbi:hypothetical protein RHMOL_Rhmol03G0069600 [Rhododendron molle]|uniref:Uncharacterized protein n=1 Tax=Rhododendron molle TaxID=49168 RepID=A0ACC0PB04_RHOML|nr:hypothetical protein RHMOL_Rhmol03G0069600 [Rhododendron molle]